MSSKIIGIDLGTTNSEVAVIEDGKVVIIGDEQQVKIIPSIVSLNDKDELLIGVQAKNQQVLYPEKTISSVKRLMGSDESISLGEKHTYTAPEVSAIILKKLKAMAEVYLNQPVEKAVITVPAYFSDQQRQATREAGKIANLEVVRIINEPTAASLAYQCTNEQEKNILVYDLGGGTFDVSIVKISTDVVEVISSHGNNHLGGDDFNDVIVDFLCARLQQEYKFEAQSDIKVMARLRHCAEQAKIALSNAPFYQIQEEYLFEQDGNPVHFTYELARDDYEDMISHFIDETFEAIHIALNDVNLIVKDVDEVILVGGSTRTPLICERLADEFGQLPRADLNPDLCVAAGAAIQAATINGEKADKILVDVTPYTFGTSAVGIIDGEFDDNVFCAIIPKNTPLPITKSKVFYKMGPEQKSIEVKVLQGESNNAAENTLIADFIFNNLSTSNGSEEIIAEFQLDIDGILHVTAREKNSKLSHSITIDGALNKNSDADIILAQAKIDNLFDAAIPKNNSEQQVVAQANKVIDKATKVMDVIEQQDKLDVIDLMEDLKGHLAENNSSEIVESTAALVDLLYYLEEEFA